MSRELVTEVETIPMLQAGDNLSREEFLRRWEAMPMLKRAELVKGVVFLPSPLSLEHGDIDCRVAYWLTHYAVHTPGCRTATNATWLMLGDAPQPDVSLRILPECGGQSRVEGHFAAGAPELAAEVCPTSAAYDLHQKLELYEAAGVREYLAVLVHEHEARWHRLVDGSYQVTAPDTDGILRSQVFPGLWLDARALLDGEMARVLAVLQEGLNSPGHAEFVARLRAARG